MQMMMLVELCQEESSCQKQQLIEVESAGDLADHNSSPLPGVKLK